MDDRLTDEKRLIDKNHSSPMSGHQHPYMAHKEVQIRLCIAAIPDLAFT